MTLIIETGTGKADAQSYISEIQMEGYFANEISKVDLSALMPRARLYIETLNFVGSENTISKDDLK
jgi:hypothetical protein